EPERPALEPATAAQAEDSRIAAALSGPDRGWALLSFFGFGLLLAFTPCVLPMIPILSGLIAGASARQGPGRGLGTGRAAALSLVYVLANALVFTVAGMVAGLVGANLQIAFQTPWVIVAFALLFVALALRAVEFVALWKLMSEVQPPAGIAALRRTVREVPAVIGTARRLIGGSRVLLALLAVVGGCCGVDVGGEQLDRDADRERKCGRDRHDADLGALLGQQLAECGDQPCRRERQERDEPSVVRQLFALA
ncbi:MAG: hypothetical protein KY442_12830, partial [Proteobacteria bacterium]|nr:hypothetical protein [Pseudomonadota bacterium]